MNIGDTSDLGEGEGEGEWQFPSLCTVYIIGITRLKLIRSTGQEPSIFVTDGFVLDRTSSGPKSVLRYKLNKVRYLDLESSLSRSCSPK